MIRNIVFDMGNVLRDYAPMRGIQPYATGEDSQLILKEMFGGELWRSLDQGTITYPDAIRRCKERLPERLHKTLEQIVAHWHEHMPEDPRMIPVVKGLKGQGYGLYLLSNASVRFCQYQESFQMLRYFDGAIVSAFHKVLKPEEKIYRILFDTYRLAPEECFFIDDNEDNVEGGRRLHMPGHVFDGDLTALRAALASFGVMI